MRYFFLSLIIVLFAMTSCRQINVREKTTTLPRYEWPLKYKAMVELDVADSGWYNLYFIVRHTEKFGFTHLPVHLIIRDTTKNAQRIAEIRFNAPLIKNDGNWAGSNMSDMYYHRIKINKPLLLNRNRYRFLLQHEIKEDPLLHVLNTGIAINKITTTH